MKRDGRTKLGHASLDVLDTLATSDAECIEDVARETGRQYRAVSACLRRLLAHGLVSKTQHVIGREGTRPARWALTGAGRARLEQELARGRAPGVSTPRRDRRTTLGHTQLDVLDTLHLAKRALRTAAIAEQIGHRPGVTTRCCIRLLDAGLVLRDGDRWAITKAGRTRLLDEMGRGRVPGVPATKMRRVLHTGDDHMARIRAFMETT